MARDAATFSNISAATAGFSLLGGYYGISVHAGTWGSGTVSLETLALDGSTWLGVINASYTADTFDYGYVLPPGQYRFNVASATGVYVGIFGAPTL